MNYFKLFDLPVLPSVDKTLLSQKYFTLQKNNHPDFFTQATDEEKETALQQSAAINEAFAIFQNEDKTLEYFLQQKGIIQTDEKYQLPSAFLMEMMELNENLTEKDQEGAAVAAEIAGLEKTLLEEVEPLLLQQYPNEDAQAMEKLKAYYYKKKYLKRILDRLHD
jgi:molecular chaperone HscB